MQGDVSFGFDLRISDYSEGDQPWDFFGGNDAEAETPVLWPPHVKSWLVGKDSDVGRYWRQEEKGMTGWDGWMASPTRWTWVWVNSGSWWWIGRPGVLQFMGSQRVGHDWATELNWTEIAWEKSIIVQWLMHFLVLPFLGIGMRIDLFQPCGHCWVFHIFWHN